jgi:uroporphyrinogen decarboxylase
MNRSERLQKTFAGERTDRVPVALWRHWPGDDQRAADLARATIDFQRLYDWDFVVIHPAASYGVIDLGLHDEWDGNPDGSRAVVKRGINRSLEWTELRPLDPQRGSLGRQLEAVRLIADHFPNGDTPLVHTIYSPLSQAGLLGGSDLLVRHLRTHPDRIQTALNVLTETTLRLIDSMRRLPLDGLLYVIDHASHDLISEDEYRTFGLPYDRKIMESLPERWWFRMMQLPSKAPLFRLCSQLPAYAINWADQDTEPDMTQGRAMFNGAMCGGLSAQRHLNLGTPASIREAARVAINAMNGRRLILSSGISIPATTPLSNIRAARESVNQIGAASA